MDRPYDAFSAHCPSRDLVEHVTSRWSSLVLVALLDNSRRFAETARTVDGISDRMLARTLATLAQDGLVTRTEVGGQHVEYTLTPAGRTIALAMRGVVDAVYAAMPTVLEARETAAS